MPRTTLNVDASVLRALRRRSREEGKSLGQLVSELVAQALSDQKGAQPGAEFQWVARPMGAKLDLEDKDALSAAVDAG